MPSLVELSGRFFNLIYDNSGQNTIFKMKKTIFTMLTLAFIGLSNSYAQVGIGTETPDASAKLDVTSSSQGFLPPRLTSIERDAIASPAQGLMIYCTNCGTNGEPQFYNGAAWVNLVSGTTACGESVTFIYNGSNVTYGTVTGADSRCWLDRNLGATQVALSSSDAASYGDLFQWGRGDDGHQIRNSETTPDLSSTDTPANGNFILAPNSPNDWRSPENTNLWQGVNGVNNPCPSGYRLPTEAEWNDEMLSWVQAPINSTNNADGAFASPLKLPVAGTRNPGNGSVVNVGTNGIYWSSSVSSTNSHYLYFNSSNALMSLFFRASGYSVRCLKD